MYMAAMKVLLQKDVHMICEMFIKIEKQDHWWPAMRLYPRIPYSSVILAQLGQNAPSL